MNLADGWMGGWLDVAIAQPENILCLSRTGNRIKIIDFGLARDYDPTVETRVMFGTPEFMAPEVARYDPIDFSTDMWSVGVICYVLYVSQINRDCSFIKCMLFSIYARAISHLMLD